ncbi:hypothetical protein GCM10009837_52450 [Streptomyces durmitorensis]
MALALQIAADQLGLFLVILRDQDKSAHGLEHKRGGPGQTESGQRPDRILITPRPAPEDAALPLVRHDHDLEVVLIDDPPGIR